MPQLRSQHDHHISDSGATGSRLYWSRHQIVQLFRAYVRDYQPISLNFGDEDTMMITRMLRLNPRQDSIYFEYTNYKDYNTRLAHSDLIQYCVEENESELQFVSPRISSSLLNGVPVFRAPIPDRIVRIDRRQHDRISIPEVSSPTVVFELPDGQVVMGQLADMSAGGIGVVGFSEDLDVRAGTVLHDCMIVLKDGEGVFVDLEIRYVRNVTGLNGKTSKRVGFSLVSRPLEFSELLDAFTVEF